MKKPGAESAAPGLVRCARAPVGTEIRARVITRVPAPLPDLRPQTPTKSLSNQHAKPHFNLPRVQSKRRDPAAGPELAEGCERGLCGVPRPGRTRRATSERSR